MKTSTTVKIPGSSTRKPTNNNPCFCGQCTPGRPDIEAIRERVRDQVGRYVFERMLTGTEDHDSEIDAAFEYLTVIEYALSLEKTKLT